MVVMAGAFAPVNLSIQNPSKSYTLDSPTAFFSSANRNGRGEDSLGFFDDDDFDRILKQKGAFQFIFDVNEDDKPEDVHIILFNPDTDKEGVHTIEFPKDSGHNMILAFESRRECVQFSLSLKEQQFFDPTPQEMKLECLEAYCEQIGVEVQVVPEGMKLTPPTENTINLGVNPNLEKEMQMLDYLFELSGSSGDMEEDIDENVVFDLSVDIGGAWE